MLLLCLNPIALLLHPRMSTVFSYGGAQQELTSLSGGVLSLLEGYGFDII